MNNSNVNAVSSAYLLTLQQKHAGPRHCQAKSPNHRVDVLHFNTQ